jgi:hypothetical protein
MMTKEEQNPDPAVEVETVAATADEDQWASEVRRIEGAEREGSVIGRASATERAPNSSDQFGFWLRPDQKVNPFNIVSAEHYDGSVTFGLVTNIKHSTDSPAHLSNFIANDFGTLMEEPQTPRQGTNVADVAVLSNTQDTYMPVQTESLVRFAGEEGVHLGLGIYTMKRKEQEERRPVCIPAGLIELGNGETAAAYLDADYVLGPESAHINISGISGLATKTSYAAFLIQSILQTMDRKVDGRSSEVTSADVATIIINVKHNDLLMIDKERRGGLPPADLDMWDRLGLTAQAFGDVEYILPAGRETERTQRPNCFGEPPDMIRTKIYAYSFRDTFDRLDVLFTDIPDQWGTLDSILGEIRQAIENNAQDWQAVRTWHDLMEKSPLAEHLTSGKKLRGEIAPSSIGRFFRNLRRMVRNRQTGIFVSQLPKEWTTIRKAVADIKGGRTYVVDIARLNDNEKTLVFGDIVRTIYELYAESDVTELPRKLIIFVDELNKYAPAARGEKSPILDDILEISERGRSLGVILIAAEQFMSAVHPRVTGNCATKVMGRTDSSELNEASYRFLNQDIKGHLTRLEKGELLLTHPIYRQPVKIKFPRPAFLQSR